MKRLAAALCLFTACAWGEGTGQYSAMLEQDPSLPTHTIYRPQDLSAVKEKLPIIFADRLDDEAVVTLHALGEKREVVAHEVVSGGVAEGVV